MSAHNPIMPRKKITIEINAEFCSEFQEQNHETSLGIMLESWAGFVRSKSTNNMVTYRIKSERK